MHVTLVELRIRAECREAFLSAVARHHAASSAEPGNLRFDVLEDATDPLHFLLYEAYVDAAAAAAHRETPHFRAWVERAGEWYAAPREATRWHGLHPATPGSLTTP